MDMIIYNYPIELGGGKMFEVSENLQKQLLKKRTMSKLTKQEAARLIGITNKTYAALEGGQKERITKTVYTKCINWLLQDED